MKFLLGLFLLVNFLESAQKLTLQQAVMTALIQYPQIKIYQKSYEIVKQDVSYAEAELMPSLDLTSDVGLTKNEFENDAWWLESNQDATALEVSYNIFNGWKQHYQILAEKSRQNSSSFAIEELSNTVSLDVVENYLRVLEQIDLMAIDQESIQDNKLILDMVQYKFDKGYGRLFELNQAKSKYQLSLVNYETQKISLEEARINLSQYLNYSVNLEETELVYPDFSYRLPNTLDDAIADAFRTHPSVAIADTNIDVAKHQYQRDLSEFYPTLDFYANGNVQNRANVQPAGDQFDYLVQVSLVYNIFDGRRDRILKQKNQISVFEKEESFRDVQRQVRNRLELAWSSYVQIQKKLDLLRQYQEMTHEAYVTIEEAYKSNQVVINLFLDTKEEYVEAQKKFLEAKYELLLAKYRVLEAVGILHKIFKG